MTRSITAAAFVAVASLLAQASPQQAPPAQTQAPVFRAGADVVSVEASVRRDRRAVTGLTAADFEITDNGVPQQIADISYEKLPIDVTVLLDVRRPNGGADDTWRITGAQVLTSIDGLFRLRLNTSVQFAARNFTVTAEDLVVTLADGSVIVVPKASVVSLRF